MGKRRDQLEIPVRQFVAFCKKEKCDPYFGVEKADKEKVAGTVIHWLIRIWDTITCCTTSATGKNSLMVSRVEGLVVHVCAHA